MILLGTSRRSTNIISSSTAKRRKTIEMREKVQSQGAFTSRAHERTSFAVSTNLQIDVTKISEASRNSTQDGELMNEIDGVGKAKERRVSWLTKFRRKMNARVKAQEEETDIKGKKIFSWIENRTK